MTARQPRRTRRRAAPAAALPRPSVPLDPAAPASNAVASTRRPATRRAHHVTNDYTYVHRDLLTVAGVGAVVIAFIVGMSFVL